MGLSGKRSHRKKWDLTRSRKAASDVMGCSGDGGMVVGRPRNWAAWAGLSSLLESEKNGVGGRSDDKADM